MSKTYFYTIRAYTVLFSEAEKLRITSQTPFQYFATMLITSPNFNLFIKTKKEKRKGLNLICKSYRIIQKSYIFKNYLKQDHEKLNVNI